MAAKCGWPDEHPVSCDCPIVLDAAAAKRLDEIMAEGPKPLRATPLSLEAFHE